MTPTDPLTLVTETWMVSRINVWAFIGFAFTALILAAGAAIFTYASWRGEKTEKPQERSRRRAMKTIGIVATVLIVGGYALAVLPASLRTQEYPYSGSYVLVDAPLSEANVIDQQTFGAQRKIGVSVDGSAYMLLLTGGDGLGFLQRAKGSNVTLYCDPKPNGTTLNCSPDSTVDDQRMGMKGVYNAQTTHKPYTGQN